MVGLPPTFSRLLYVQNHWKIPYKFPRMRPPIGAPTAADVSKTVEIYHRPLDELWPICSVENQRTVVAMFYAVRRFSTEFSRLEPRGVAKRACGRQKMYKTKTRAK